MWWGCDFDTVRLYSPRWLWKIGQENSLGKKRGKKWLGHPHTLSVQMRIGRSPIPLRMPFYPHCNSAIDLQSRKKREGKWNKRVENESREMRKRRGMEFLRRFFPFLRQRDISPENPRLLSYWLEVNEWERRNSLSNKSVNLLDKEIRETREETTPDNKGKEGKQKASSSVVPKKGKELDIVHRTKRGTLNSEKEEIIDRECELTAEQTVLQSSQLLF